MEWRQRILQPQLPLLMNPAAPTPTSSRPTQLFTALVVGTLLLTCSYLIARTTLFLLTDYAWYERIFSLILLTAEAFVMCHGAGYFANILRTLRRPESERGVALPRLETLETYPRVGVVVAAYKEPLAVIEANLICFRNLTYPNKSITLLDDTRYDQPNQDVEKMKAYRADVEALCAEIGVNLFRRIWHGAKAGIINDFLDFIAGREKPGFEFTDNQGVPRTEPEKYLAVFDADMNPLPDFAEELVQILEANDRLAFVQTPQYYTNFEANRVARAAGLQQAVFYEYICEGKSNQDAMFCCGTNVMFRREAFEDVGGFDDTSVTEDFATSLKFHLNGWNSAFLNKVCAFGMGPQDLGGYFKQQFRWALGTVGLLREILVLFLHRAPALSAAKWSEYFLSCTHYFVGWVFLVLWLSPILFLFFGVPREFAHPGIFFAFFFPYLLLTLFTFILTLRQRNYGGREIFTGILLTTISFPVYVKASALALAGFRGSFGITPKDGGTSLPLTTLWTQVAALTLSFAATIWGLNELYYARISVLAYVVNSSWCFYNFLILSSVFYFNRPEADSTG